MNTRFLALAAAVVALMLGGDDPDVVRIVCFGLACLAGASLHD